MLRLAEMLLRRGMAGEALDTLERGLEVRPTYVAARVLRGRCLLALGRLEKAGEELEKVLAGDSTQLVAAKLLVEVWLGAAELERASEAVASYARLQPLDPDLGALQERLAALRSEAEPSRERDVREGRAVESCGQKDTSARPSSGLTTVTLAELYLEQGHTRDAEAMLREILESEPGNVAAQAALARALGGRRRLPRRLPAAI